MRKTILAALAFSTVLAHAQAPASAKASNVLESRLAAPAEFVGAGDRTSTHALRISTGVVAPKLIHSTDVSLDNFASMSYTGPRHVVVGMTVGTDGIPTNLHIVQSAGVLIDKNVLAAVSQYRFTPGTVSNQPTAVPVNLDITLVGSGR